MFAAAPSCEVIHGTIYTCLRAMFGLSVIGILVSIFSCMLVYQVVYVVVVVIILEDLLHIVLIVAEVILIEILAAKTPTQV